MQSITLMGTYRIAGCTFAGIAALLSATAAVAADTSIESAPLQEVVVTAQKRSENIQNVPATVSVVGSQQLEDFHVNQLTDIGAYVAGLQIDSGGTPGQTTISMRGIAPLSSGSTVSTYVDETPIGSSSYHQRTQFYALDILPYDLQRIEVLEGPQGTLYGANSLGGLLKYVLTKPNLDRTEIRLGGELSGVDGAGNVGGGARAMINTPVVDGKLGIIASYAYQRTPGYIDNSLTGEKDQNGARQQSGRLALRWEPTTAVSVHLGALLQKITANGNASVALDPVTLESLRGGLFDNNPVANTFNSKLEYYSGAVNWDLGWASFVSATSYSDQQTVSVQDATLTYQPIYATLGFPASLSAFDLNLENKKYTQEFRLASPSNQKLEWLAGTFYDHETSANHQVETAQLLNGASIPDLDPSFVGALPITYVEYAAFGDLTYHFTNRFDIAGGVRYAHNSQHFHEVCDVGCGAPLIIPGQSSEGVWTYSVSPRLHLTDRTMTYVRVASGYQPVGPNTDLPGVPPSVKSDTLVNYEIGIKSSLWERRLTLNASVYDLQWKDIQVVGSTPGGFTYTTNGGTARSRGIQIDASINPFDHFQLLATVDYTDSKLTEDIPSVGGLSGDPLPYVPTWSGSLRADYGWAVISSWNAHVGSGLRLVGNRFSSGPFRLVQYETPAYTALDLNASLSNDRWTVGLFAKNLANKRAYLTDTYIPNGLTAAAAQVEGMILQPRTVGISLDFKM